MRKGAAGAVRMGGPRRVGFAGLPRPSFHATRSVSGGNFVVSIFSGRPSWGRLRCRLGILDKIAASCPLNAMTAGCRSGVREGCSESTWPAPQGSDGDGEVGLASWVFANRCAPNQNPQGLFMAREPLEQSG